MNQKQFDQMAIWVVDLRKRVKELEAKVERLESNSHPPVDVRAVVREMLHGPDDAAPDLGEPANL